MRRVQGARLIGLVLVAVGAAPFSSRVHAQVAPDDGGRVHTAVHFAFDAKGSMAEVMPLFGADRERVWAEDWNPRFVYPSPAADRPGMVFLVSHGHFDSTWVNTELDLTHGVAQYVYVVPATFTTRITIHATPHGAGTHVEVAYERTSLDASADAHVEHMAEADRNAGPDWARQINGYLSKAHAAMPR